MSTILLTGSTGFIGSHLLGSLIDKKHSVIVLLRSTSNTGRIKACLSAKNVKVYDVDVVTLESIFQSNEIDLVLHLATFYKKSDSAVEVKEMLESNVVFPAEILALSSKYGIKGFVNTGTFFECDCSINPITELSASKPFNYYSKTKIMFEGLLKSYAESLDVITLRLFSPYGPKDNQKLIPYIIQKALLDESIGLSDGFQKLDFIYVDDIVFAFLSALDLILKRENNGIHDLYNIGGGKSFSVREVVSVIEQIVGFDIKKTWGEPSVMDNPLVVADISKAKTELKWEPAMDLHSGLAKTVESYKDLL